MYEKYLIRIYMPAIFKINVYFVFFLGQIPTVLSTFFFIMQTI